MRCHNSSLYFKFSIIQIDTDSRLSRKSLTVEETACDGEVARSILTFRILCAIYAEYFWKLSYINIECYIVSILTNLLNLHKFTLLI